MQNLSPCTIHHPPLYTFLHPPPSFSSPYLLLFPSLPHLPKPTYFRVFPSIFKRQKRPRTLAAKPKSRTSICFLFRIVIFALLGIVRGSREYSYLNFKYLTLFKLLQYQILYLFFTISSTFSFTFCPTRIVNGNPCTSSILD